MKALIIAEHDHHSLKPNNDALLTAAQQLDAELDVFVIGHACQAAATVAQRLPGIRQVLVADASDYAQQLAENVAPLIVEIAIDYDYIIAAASTFGKNILPRVAALLDVAMVSDVVKIISADTFVRPIYAGNALATVQTSDTKKLLTVRTTAFAALKEREDGTAPLVSINKIIPNKLTHFEKHELTQSSRPELTSARVIISGGRGLKSADNFKILESLAECLGAALGASRAAVDAGFAPNDYQVGQTGKIVAPDLYIAVGISGAIQHLAGMKESKVIVAINNDADAPIFQIADYGLVGDLFKILPELQTELCKAEK